MTQEALDYIREDCEYDAAVDRYLERKGYMDSENVEEDDDDYRYDGLDPAFSSWDDYYNYRYGR